MSEFQSKCQKFQKGQCQIKNFKMASVKSKKKKNQGQMSQFGLLRTQNM